MAVKITQNGVTKTLPEAHEIDARIKKLVKDNENVFNSVNSCDSRFAFPSIGRGNVIYKDELTRKLYQWNTTKLCYEELTNSDIANINCINGGLADTIFNDNN